MLISFEIYLTYREKSKTDESTTTTLATTRTTKTSTTKPSYINSRLYKLNSILPFFIIIVSQKHI